MNDVPTERRGIAWELVGILAVVAVFLVGFLIWAASPERGAELQPPEAQTLDPELNLESGLMEDGRPYVGAADAAVTVYEFGDFQCAHCGQFVREEAAQIKADYLASGKARLVWVNFPIYGDESDQTAKVAICASEQGRFWDVHDWLFANQPSVPESGGFSNERLDQIAAAVGLDTTALESCLADPATADRLQADKDFGNENSVGSTPSFLVGERLVVGGDITELRAAMDAAPNE